MLTASLRQCSPPRRGEHFPLGPEFTSPDQRRAAAAAEVGPLVWAFTPNYVPSGRQRLFDACPQWAPRRTSLFAVSAGELVPRTPGHRRSRRLPTPLPLLTSPCPATSRGTPHSRGRRAARSACSPVLVRSRSGRDAAAVRGLTVGSRSVRDRASLARLTPVVWEIPPPGAARAVVGPRSARVGRPAIPCAQPLADPYILGISRHLVRRGARAGTARPRLDRAGVRRALSATVSVFALAQGRRLTDSRLIRPGVGGLPGEGDDPGSAVVDPSSRGDPVF